MKIAFSTLGCPHYGIDEIIDIAVKNKYDGIEIRAVKGTTDIASLPEFKEGGLAETIKKLRDSGLAVACLGTSLKFCEAGKANQEKMLDDAKVCLEIAKALNCKYIRTFGGPMPLMQGYTESMKWTWDGYQRLCDLTDTMGVMPLIETHDDFSTSPRVLDLINGVGRGKMGVVWDILHPLRYGEPVKATFEALKDMIFHVHVKDSAEFDARGFDFSLLGEGKVPVAECLAMLSGNGYDGYLSFEWEKLWHPEIPEPEVAIPHYAVNVGRFV